MPILNNNYLQIINDTDRLLNALNISRFQCYCIIQVNNNDNLKLSFYKTILPLNSSFQKYLIPVVFIAKTAKNICMLLQYHNNIFSNLSCDHALYLGRELIKAEIALIMHQQFVQD
jgi:Domain of unknown function (DUF4346)